MRMILASSSPRRQTLLREAGFDFEVVPPRVAAESTPRPGETPSVAVQRIAAEKAADVAQQVGEGLIVAADTLVECEGTLVGKPLSRDDARRILQFLSGKVHRVYTGLCLRDAHSDQQRLAFDETLLEMLPLTAEELERYLDSNGWQGKAGAFGYQDGNDWVRIVRGSESNVVGLPLELLDRMLRAWPSAAAQ